MVTSEGRLIHVAAHDNRIGRAQFFEETTVVALMVVYPAGGTMLHMLPDPKAAPAGGEISLTIDLRLKRL